MTEEVDRTEDVTVPPRTGELLDRIDEVAADLRSTATDLPVWFDLIETQQAIDRGNPARAKRSLELFLENWNGEPAELMVYVEDFERYLRMHGGTAP